MHKEMLIAFFKQLVPLTPEDEQRVLERCSSLSVPAKTYLLQAGEIGQQVYFVGKGCVRIAIVNREGEDISCYFATEGQFAADYQSFITGKPASYSIQCLEPCALLTMDRKGLEELYALNTHGERIGRLIAEHLFLDTQERLTSFYVESPEQRYADFAAKFPGLLQRIPQHHVAAYIGVRPQSLSRIKRRALELARH